jgi:hypothetical protein
VNTTRFLGEESAVPQFPLRRRELSRQYGSAVTRRCCVSSQLSSPRAVEKLLEQKNCAGSLERGVFCCEHNPIPGGGVRGPAVPLKRRELSRQYGSAVTRRCCVFSQLTSPRAVEKLLEQKSCAGSLERGVFCCEHNPIPGRGVRRPAVPPKKKRTVTPIWIGGNAALLLFSQLTSPRAVERSNGSAVRAVDRS